MIKERIIPVSFDQCSEFHIDFNPDDDFEISFENEPIFGINFCPGETFDVEFRISYESQEKGDYIGPYIVTPTSSNQILPTAGKTLSKNVTVKETPFSKVSNKSGGYTVTIL